MGGCCTSSPSLTLSPSAPAIPANGVSTVVIHALVNGVWPGTRTTAPLTLTPLEGQELIVLSPPIPTHEGYDVTLRAGTRPGKVLLEATLPGSPSLTSSVAVTLFRDTGDDDRDGFDNELELRTHDDRLAFRRWFVAIARAQATQRSSDFEIIHQDCAGLLRYAYKEALRVHDAAWLEAHQGVPANTGRDVSPYHYPDLPILGDALFRTGDPSMPFSAAVSGRVLRDFNTTLVSRSTEAAESGDLLFFELETPHGRALHAMLAVRDHPDAALELVYHTGPMTEGQSVPDGSGEVRHVALSTLLNHPEPAWHPRAHNPSFLGVFRWRILT